MHGGTTLVAFIGAYSLIRVEFIYLAIFIPAYSSIHIGFIAKLHSLLRVRFIACCIHCLIVFIAACKLPGAYPLDTGWRDSSLKTVYLRDLSPRYLLSGGIHPPNDLQLEGFMVYT